MESGERWWRGGGRALPPVSETAARARDCRRTNPRAGDEGGDGVGVGWFGDGAVGVGSGGKVGVVELKDLFVGRGRGQMEAKTACRIRAAAWSGDFRCWFGAPPRPGGSSKPSTKQTPTA